MNYIETNIETKFVKMVLRIIGIALLLTLIILVTR
jgi:hypothetical protein